MDSAEFMEPLRCDHHQVNGGHPVFYQGCLSRHCAKKHLEGCPAWRWTSEVCPPVINEECAWKRIKLMT